jgi:hypothetical protein
MLSLFYQRRKSTPPHPARHLEQKAARLCLSVWFAGECRLLLVSKRRILYSKRKIRVSSKCKNFSQKYFSRCVEGNTRRFAQ